MKRVARITLIVLATVTLLILLWQLRQVVVLFLLSLATASAFRPLIDLLKARGVPKTAALLGAYFSVILLIGALLFLVSRPLIEDLQASSNRLTILYDLIKTSWPNGSPTQRTIAAQLPTLNNLYRFIFGNGSVESLQTLAGLSNAMLNFFGNLALILILSIYWSTDNLRFERLWLAMLAPETRPRARETFEAIEAHLGAYIRSEVIQSLLAGVLLWVGYQTLGMQYAVLMAVFGALAWLIPWFGALIAIFPPLLLGFAQGGIPLAGLAAAYTLLVLFVQERIIEPRFFTRQTYSSIILVVMILILADEFGLIGLILAPLASAAIQITLRYLLQPPVSVVVPERMEAARAGEEIHRLEAQIQSVEQSLTEGDEEPALDLMSKINRLKKLAADARQYIEERPELIERTQPTSDRERMPLPE